MVCINIYLSSCRQQRVRSTRSASIGDGTVKLSHGEADVLKAAISRRLYASWITVITTLLDCRIRCLECCVCVWKMFMDFFNFDTV